MKRKLDLTIMEAEAILLAGLDYADDEPSKVNPALTRKQAFDIFMGAVQEWKKAEMLNIQYRTVARNIQREFGTLEGDAAEILEILEKAT